MPSTTNRVLAGTMRAVALVMLLWAAGLERARSEASGPRVSSDSLSASAVAFALRYDVSLSPETSPEAFATADRWLARDKAKHVAFSALWTLSTQYVLVNKAGWPTADALPASVASGAAVGLAKELYDASRPTETASGKDLVADVVGIGLAAGVIVL